MRRFVTWPHPYEPRQWQRELWEAFETKRDAQQDFLAVACPGAGKTDGSLPILASLLESRSVQRVVVVAPTDDVCEQWLEKSARYGIQLTRAGAETKDFHGVVVTYAQVVNGWSTHQTLCSRERTVALFDEIHHAADPMAWGDSIRRAFDRAAYRIMLSGTPFRSDNNRIPFITYANDECKPDFVYGYQRALDDEVVRPAFFPTIDGSAEWMMKKNGSDEWVTKSADLTERLSDSEASARLRCILDPDGDWMRTTAEEARAKLLRCRELGHSDAGELWVCVDQAHAKKTRDMIWRITGEEPVLAISEDPKAGDKIRAFSGGKQKCLVSVRKVSEGVDIPRLRVLVYATNIINSEMFFRQALGRIVRWVEGLDEQWSYMFIPRVETLVEFALKVIEERTHYVEEQFVEEAAKERQGGEGQDTREIRVMPVSSQGILSNVIAQGEELTQYAIEEARKIHRYIQGTIQVEDLALALVRAGHIRAGDPGGHRATPSVVKEVPLEHQKKDLKRRISHLANQIAWLLNIDPQTIHADWLRRGGASHDKATLEQLQSKFDWLTKKLQDEDRKAGN